MSAKKTIISILLISIGAAAFVLVRSYTFSKMGETIQTKLDSLKLSGFNVKYDSIYINWQKNLLVVDHLVLEKNAYDTTCVYPEFIAVTKISAQGFRLLPLIFQNRLSFKKVSFENPHLVIRINSQLMVDSATQRENEFTLTVDEVVMSSARIEYTDTLNCDLLTGFKSDVSLDGLKLDFHVNQPLAFSADRITLDSTQFKLPKEFYTLNILHAKIDAVNKTLHLDSLGIVPDLGKIAFGRKFGREIDRYEGIVPHLDVSGFSFSPRDSMEFTAVAADVQFYLKIFRDKRLPFKNKVKLLPVAMLKGLPFALSIDSLTITKSYVQYEELVKDPDDAGVIYFDNISGVIKNIDNRSTSGNATLTARADLMGQGDIQMSVTFPLSKNKKSWLRGSVQNFSIPKINPMLTPSTNMKVESGLMNRLSFSFAFNDVRSEGEIELDYNDLKLVTFKDENKKTGGSKKLADGELKKDNFKTFILNTFIFRKNMDKDQPEEKRTGTVSYLRDDHKSIFNFWVKSVLSGIKSAYNLDKPLAQKAKRLEKKEERLTKRDARKQKKAEKRKERG